MCAQKYTFAALSTHANAIAAKARNTRQASAANMAELWSLRITVKGATKTFGNVDPDDTVATLAERAARTSAAKEAWI